MYVVIFRAKAGQIDSQYNELAGKLRQRAISEFGCTDFVAVTEGEDEIALSYWQNEADILRWKQDTEHQLAQQIGRDRWYRYYSVEVCQMKHRYQSKP